MTDPALPPMIGHYRILHRLGEGGMGVVVAARDERLGRPVALKLLRSDATGSEGSARQWREARAAAAIRHPAICQVFEIGEDQQQIFIAMEWLDGETLASRLARGPLPVSEALDYAIALLDALAAIHDEGLLHRDLKPSNLMLTTHGLKVLDFGLARAAFDVDGSVTRVTAPVTEAGAVIGTLAYIAPELINGARADARSDLFAVGAILFEMLAGRPAFQGATSIALAHAILHEQPSALAGGPAIAAIDRLIRRALSKDPRQRFASVQGFAFALRDVRRPDPSITVTAHPTRRLIVLPFRAMRVDSDTDFLCASLPESVTATLSQLDSLVVRSSLSAARFGPSPDPQRLASEAEVDVALTGTLMSAGGEVLVNAQLVEVPGGALIESCTFRSPSRNVFELHDAIVTHLVHALTPHLTAREDARLRRDVPASHTAYELFLRGNELGRDKRRITEAIERYQESLAIDPEYAPAWAQLGRLHRVLSKYVTNPTVHFQQAKAAFDRALALNPDLDTAHAYYAQLEADMGQSQNAMRRLLTRASIRGAAPEVYAGLVYTSRFCGLMSESITFHHEARRLDPTVPTSVTQTYFQSGDYLRCLETAADDIGYIVAAALDAMGKREEALTRLRARLREWTPPEGARLLLQSLRAALEGARDECVVLSREFLDGGFVGSESEAYIARQLVIVGEHDEGVQRLASSVKGGFNNVGWFERDRWLDAVRRRSDFAAVLDMGRAAHDAARAAFAAAGGDELLAKARDTSR
jgi:serine/threonine protein kinase/tetratricopeptide (TPR) repeat protein